MISLEETLTHLFCGQCLPSAQRSYHSFFQKKRCSMGLPWRLTEQTSRSAYHPPPRQLGLRSSAAGLCFRAREPQLLKRAGCWRPACPGPVPPRLRAQGLCPPDCVPGACAPQTACPGPVTPRLRAQGLCPSDCVPGACVPQTVLPTGGPPAPGEKAVPSRERAAPSCCKWGKPKSSRVDPVWPEIR